MASQSDPVRAQPVLLQAIEAMTACFKGLWPSDDDMFDLVDETVDPKDKQAAVAAARLDGRAIALRERIERSVASVVQVWTGDGEIADVSRCQLAVSVLMVLGDILAIQILNFVIFRDPHLSITLIAPRSRLRCS